MAFLKTPPSPPSPLSRKLCLDNGCLILDNQIMSYAVIWTTPCVAAVVCECIKEYLPSIRIMRWKIQPCPSCFALEAHRDFLLSVPLSGLSLNLWCIGAWLGWVKRKVEIWVWFNKRLCIFYLHIPGQLISLCWERRMRSFGLFEFAPFPSVQIIFVDCALCAKPYSTVSVILINITDSL